MEPVELRLGSITGIWKSRPDWSQFRQYLETMEPEGDDSQGTPMKLSRYAYFLELYVNLYEQEKHLREEVIDDQEFVAASIAAEKTSRKNSSIKSSLRSLSIMEDEEDKEDKKNSEEDGETGTEEEKIAEEYPVGSKTSAKDLYTEKEIPPYTIHL